MIKKYERTFDIIAVIILAAVLILGVFGIIDKKVMDVVPTYYRVFIPIIFIWCVVRHYQTENKILPQQKITRLLLGFMILWFIYAGIQLFVCQYVNQAEGIHVIIELVLNTLAVCCIIQLCGSNENLLNIFLNCIRFIVCLLTVIGLIEIITGSHLGISMFSDRAYINEYIKQAGKLPPDGVLSNAATGIFYNVNDFSAFLGMFSVLFFPFKGQKPILKAAYYFELFFVAIILLRNDAWICIISIIIGIIAYLAVTRAKWHTWLISATGICLLQKFGFNIFEGFARFVYDLFGIKIPVFLAKGDEILGVGEAVTGQLGGMYEGYGSLYTRFNTYIESIMSTFTKSYGLGFGPGSITNYMKNLGREDILLNPHSLWTEILFQFGILVFAACIAILVWTFFKLCKTYFKTRKRQYAYIIALDIVFIFISFAPSSFLGYAFAWIPIGISLCVVLRRNIE